MNSINVFNAVANIDEAVIDDLIGDKSGEIKEDRGKRVKIIAAIGFAAAICLLSVLGVASMLKKNGDQSDFVIPINKTAPADSPAQVSLGDNVDALAGNASAEMVIAGLCARVKAVSVNDGIYRLYGDFTQKEYRIVLFEIKEVYYGKNAGKSFYVIVPKDFQADFLAYDEFIVSNLPQIALDYYVVYNETEGKAEMLTLPVFGYYGRYSFVDIYDGVYYPYNDGKIDVSFRDEYVKYINRKYGRDENSNSTDETREELLTKFGTVEKALEYLREHGPWMSNMNYERTVFTIGEMADENANRLLEYVSDFENGIFVNGLSYNAMLASGNGTTFRRYVNGFPTDEIYRVWVDYPNDGSAVVSHTEFAEDVYTKTDIESLPDLSFVLETALQLTKEGEVVPPHLADTTAAQDMKCGVNGWYAKNGDNVYGVICAKYAYRIKNADGYLLNYLDEQYFIVADGKMSPITRDELLELIPNDPYVYKGEYGEYGREGINYSL